MTSEPRVTAIVVVYNKSIENSSTCAGIRECGHTVDIVVVDNSECDYGNTTACAVLGYRYVSMSGNAGLSKAYNTAIDVSEGADAFILLDDDTEVGRDYFDTLFEALSLHDEVDVFAPVMVGQDGVVWSPNNSNFMKNELLSSADEDPDPARFNAIASCLCLRARVFKDYRFDERLFVDQIDQNLCDDLRAQKRSFMKLPVIVKQNFYQRGESLTPEQGWGRLRLRIIDMMRYSRIKGWKYVAMGYAKCCGLGLQIARKTGSAVVFGKALRLSTSLLVKPR